MYIIIISRQITVNFDFLCSGPWYRTCINKKKKNNKINVLLQHSVPSILL